MAEDRRITNLDRKTILLAKADTLYQKAIEANDLPTALEALKLMAEWEHLK